jgi:hypothetical protein
MARSVDPKSGLPARRQLDLALAQIRWEPAAQRVNKPPVSTVTVQYLHN